MPTPERASFADIVCRQAAKDTCALENTFMNLSWNPFSSVFSWTLNRFVTLIYIRTVNRLLFKNTSLKTVIVLT